MEHEFVLMAVFDDPVDDAGKIVARACPVRVEVRHAAGETDARLARFLRADAVKDDGFIVGVEEKPRQVIRDHMEFVARDSEFRAVVIGERGAGDRDGVAAVYEKRDRLLALPENVAVAVVDGNVLLHEDVVDLVGDGKLVLVLCGEQDIAEPFEVAESACALETEGREMREDFFVVEKKACVAGEQVVVSLGKQLGNEQDAVIGAAADVDVRGSEKIGPVRIQTDSFFLRKGG